MTRPIVLLAGVATLALAAGTALAQTQTAANDDVPATVAPTVADPNGGADAGNGEIVVLGFGQSRQVQSVSAVDIARVVPGASPLKAIEKLPGVNFQSADPFGNYEWAVRISLRGFNQNQLGFTLDGIPLGDMSYGNVNGLHISRAIISENVARTEVAQGAGAVGTASTSNLGGTLQFFSADPKDKPGVSFSGTYGSDDTKRGYIRLDSGTFANVLAGYVSYAYADTDKWKGYGQQKQQQVNAKLVADLGDAGRISAFFDYSDRHEQDYQDLSLDIIARRGLRDDNITNDYPLARQIATAYQTGQPLPAGFGTVDDAYYDAGGLRRDYLTGVTFDARLTPGVSLKTTGYYHVNQGQGSWITPYNITPLGAPNADGTPITNPADLSFRTTEYHMRRGGVLSDLTVETGVNTLGTGIWYESNTFSDARRLYGMTNTAEPNRKALDYQANPYRTAFAGKFDTQTLQYHVVDTLKLIDDKLVINAGWKGVQVLNAAQSLIGTYPTGRIHSRDWFQPQAGAVFHLGDGVEVFAGYTENMRAFTSTNTGGPFATGSQALFDAAKGNIKPERSRTYEGGVRFRAGPLQASAVGYYVDFSNRLLAIQNGVGILGLAPTLQNVGAVRNYGGEFSVNYRILPPVSVFASYSYNRSQYRDDVVSGGVTYATDGKTVVDSPKHMIKGELVYDDHQFMARVGADYMTKRYFTYLNDQSVPSRVLVDASIGYTLHGSGFLDGLSIVGNVTNLTDKKYISTVGSNGFTFQGDNQTLLAGAPRQWFVTLKKGF